MPFKIGLKEKRRKKLEEELGRLLPEIIRMGVEKIIIFGSLASNEIHKSSDIDIIVVQKSHKRFLDRIEEFYQKLRPHVATDFFIYTPDEFNELKERSLFIKSALKKGRILYEK